MSPRYDEDSAGSIIPADQHRVHRQPLAGWLAEGRDHYRHPFWSVSVLGVLVALVLLMSPPAALSHPLDEYLQATYITINPADIEIELDLTPGVLVAPDVLQVLDTDRDQQLSDAEGRAYVAEILRDVSLSVDGQPLVLDVSRIELPTYLNIQAGYGTFGVFAVTTLPKSAAGTYHLSYSNTFAPTKVTYQVNTFVAPGSTITLGTQNRDALQQTLTVDYTVSSSVQEDLLTETPVENTTALTGQSGQLLSYLDASSLAPWELLLALGVALFLGGLHALTPGHGKTLVAAYLVGSRGTVRHAVALGGIVTFTHTASVIIIGLLALFASQYVVPEILVPVLEVGAGLLVVIIGVRLVWQRWRTYQQQQSLIVPAHSEDHSHAHGHSHGDDHSHAHSHAAAHHQAPGDEHEHLHAHGIAHDHGDGHVHTHYPPERVTVGSLLAMGISGGIVPCPEALGIMIIAIGLNRILLGLGLIVSFSLGLAAVLIIIGILLVRSRSLVERLGGLGGRFSRILPLGSAVIVTVLGAAIVVRGVLAYLA